MVKVEVGSLASQASSSSSIVSARISTLQGAIGALERFLGESCLEGAAYTSAKSYASQVLIPLVQAMILYSESVSENTSQLQSQYSSICKGESLDSDNLERQIQQLEASYRAARRTYDILLRELSPLAAEYSILLGNIRRRITKLQTKLDRLYRFNAVSAHTFSDIGSLEVALMTGLNQVSANFSGFSASQGFPSYNKSNLSWAKTVNSQWEKRTEAIRSGYDAVVKKVEKGEELTEEDIRVINRYVHENPHLTLAPSIQNALYHFSVNRNIDDMVQKLVDGGKLPIEAYTKFKELVDSDAVSRLSQVMALLPKPLVNSILVSDGFWEILASVEKSGAKGAKAVSLILNGLSKYEALAVKYGKFSELIDEASSLVQNIASPVRAVATSTLGKLSGMSSLEAAVTKGKNLVGNAKFLGKAVKVLGKVGTVMTFAQIGFEGISGGIEEYTESKDVGKAIGQGMLDAVASVGPLEGATIGAAIASVVPIPGVSQAVGAGIGFAVGLGIQGIKMIEPKFFDDPVKGTKNIINKTGKAIKNAVDVVSDTLGGFGKVLGFG
ncbi:TPA: hypothetical protein TY888_002130 [Streptococcus suis]|nr:hypothetical protein [Streptococcus suis]HEL2072775.1 hypothetical protein [Streptococcus suis]HEM2581904.1 hypothetical protein [Streptococcus suis]